MKLLDLHMTLGLFLGIILPFRSQVRVTADSTTAGHLSIPTTQRPTIPNSNTVLSTLVSQETVTSTKPMAVFESMETTQTATDTSASLRQALPSPTFPSDGLSSPLATTNTHHELSTLDDDPTKTRLCKESNKQQMLICLVIIGVLAFICVGLLLVIVVLASKLTFAKRRKPSKRLPRSNGDFLSTNSLWPMGLETLQRISSEEPNGQGLGPNSTTEKKGKSVDEVSKKLVNEITDRQKQKKTSTKTHDQIITSIEI